MSATANIAHMVSIKELKRWALEKLPRNIPLRDLLLSYPDELEAEAIVHLIPTWLRILNGSG